MLLKPNIMPPAITPTAVLIMNILPHIPKYFDQEIALPRVYLTRNFIFVKVQTK